MNIDIQIDPWLYSILTKILISTYLIANRKKIASPTISICRQYCYGFLLVRFTRKKKNTESVHYELFEIRGKRHRQWTQMANTHTHQTNGNNSVTVPATVPTIHQSKKYCWSLVSLLLSFIQFAFQRTLTTTTTVISKRDKSKKKKKMLDKCRGCLLNLF